MFFEHFSIVFLKIRAPSKPSFQDFCDFSRFQTDGSPRLFGRFQYFLVFSASTPRDTYIVMVSASMTRQWTVDRMSTKCMVRQGSQLPKIVMEATFRLSKALPEVQGVREWCFLVPSDWERKVTRGILIKHSSFKNFGFFVKF